MEECKICNKKYKNYKSLSLHIRQTHKIESQLYFDKYLKKEDEGKCAVCGKPTNFKSLSMGYYTHCSIACSVKDENVILKSKETLHKNYGEEGLKNPIIRQKAEQTSMERYGETNPAKSEEVKDKIKQTFINNFGVEHNFQAEVVKEKIKQTNLEKRGVPYSSQDIEIRKRTSITMKTSGKYKQQQTVMKNWGVKHISQSEEIKRRKNETYKKNNTFNTSKQENEVYFELLKIFNKDDVYRNFKDERYPFNCDFYIKSLDLFIECNFHWSHSGHWFEENNIDDINKLKLWKEKAVKSQYYKNAITTWTIRDVNKKIAAEKQQLNYIVFWNYSDFQLWLNNIITETKLVEYKYEWRNDT